MLIFSDTPESLSGEFCLNIFKNGEFLERIEEKNLIVDAGRVRLAELAAGKSASHISQIGIGSGSERESEGDVQLENQLLLPLKNISIEGHDARFDFEIGIDDANGLSIREFALFCADNTMFSHKVRVNQETGAARTIEKENDIQITGYWIIHF